MQIFCQIGLIVILTLRGLAMVWTDFHGIGKNSPYGFSGFIVSLLIVIVNAAILYGAGAFSQLF